MSILRPIYLFIAALGLAVTAPAERAAAALISYDMVFTGVEDGLFGTGSLTLDTSLITGDGTYALGAGLAGLSISLTLPGSSPTPTRIFNFTAANADPTDLPTIDIAGGSPVNLYYFGLLPDHDDDFGDYSDALYASFGFFDFSPYPDYDISGIYTIIPAAPSAVPEPATCLLLGTGLLALGLVRRRRAA